MELLSEKTPKMEPKISISEMSDSSNGNVTNSSIHFQAIDAKSPADSKRQHSTNTTKSKSSLSTSSSATTTGTSFSTENCSEKSLR